MAPPPQEDPRSPSLSVSLSRSAAELLLPASHARRPPRPPSSPSGSAAAAAQRGAGLDCGPPQSSQSLSGCSPTLELLQSPLNSHASSWGQSRPFPPAGAQLSAPPPRSSNQKPAAAAVSQESRGSRLLLEALSTVYLFSEPPADDPHRPRPALQASPARVPSVTHNALAEDMEEEGGEDDLSTGERVERDARPAVGKLWPAGKMWPIRLTSPTCQF